MGQCNRKHRRVHSLNSQDEAKPPSQDTALIFLAASEKSKLNKKPKSALAVSLTPRPKSKIQLPVVEQTKENGVKFCDAALSEVVNRVDYEAAGPAVTLKNVCDTNVHLESDSSSVRETSGDAQTPIPSIQNSLPGQLEASRTLPSSPHGQSESLALPRGRRTKVMGRCAYIAKMEAQMGSEDYLERIRAIDCIVETCNLNLSMVTACIFPVFDNIRGRLVESNRIVNLHMLRALKEIIPQVKECLPKVVNLLIPAIVDNHLNSTDPAISSAAVVAIDTLVQNIDNTLLMEILATKAQLLSGQAKLDLTRTVADMVEEVYPQKPKMVEMEVLPLLWHMLAVSSDSTVTAALVRALCSQMGPKLRTYAATQPPSITKAIDFLLHTI